MPAINKARKYKEPSKGRPSGSVTKFPGSVVFCTEVNKHPSHLYRVLIGERQSPGLIKQYAAWLKSKNIPWPSEAAVNAQGRAA